tara:strand:+ start:2866 stop:4119 length:1254 start_codon:yes stop_codon:yes gene_type:complete
MSILATKPDLDKIITKAVKRIGENHALARDNKGTEFKASEIEEDRKEFRKGRTNEIANETMDSVIEESLKAVADEMAEKMVLENTIQGMIKDVIQEQETVTVTVGGEEYNVSKTIKDIITKNNPFKTKEDLVRWDSEGLEIFRQDLLKQIGRQGAEGRGLEPTPEEREINTIFKPLVKAAKEKETIDGFHDDDKEDIEYMKSIGMWDEDTTIDESTTHTIKKLVTKKLKDKLGEGRHPGYDAYEKAVKKSKTENVKAMKDTKKKFKEYENFEGNENPEFPHQEMSQTNADGQYQYYRNDEKQQEFVDDFAHPGLIDFDINNVNMDRLTKYLEGSIETGNAQTDSDGEALGNVVPSDLGEKMLKSMKRRKEKVADQQASMTNLRGITPDVQKVKQVKEDVNIDVNTMKKLWGYNKKTQ